MRKMKSDGIPSNDVVWNTIGEFGRWQKRSVFLVFLSKTVSCWCMAIILFTAPVPSPLPVRCYENFTDLNLMRSVTSDTDVNETMKWQTVLHPELIVPTDRLFDIDFCSVENDISSHVDAYIANSLTNKESELKESHDEVPCSEFKHRAFFHSKKTKFDQICSRNFVGAFTQFFFLFGVLTGGLIAFRLLEIVSPRNLLLCGIVSQIVTGIFLAFIGDYKLHLLMRFLNSVSCAQMFTSGQALLTDIIGPRYIRSILPLFETFWSIGELTMPLLLYSLDTWQHLFLAISLPSTVYFVICAIWLPDSPRWHMQNGNIAEAAEIISDAAVVNGKSCLVAADFIEGLRPERFTQKPLESGSWTELWQLSSLNIFCIHLVAGATLCAFNGMLLNARNLGADQMHVNIALTGISELTGVLIAYLFFIDNSRKWLWNGLINICVGFTVIFAFLSTTADSFQGEYYPYIMTLNFTLKASVSLSATMVLSSAAQLVEPKNRPMLMFSCTIWSRICLLCASTIASLSIFTTLLPLMGFACMNTVSGFAMCMIDTTAAKKRKNIAQFELQEVEKLTVQ